MLSSLFNENKNKAINIISLTVLFFITDRNELIVLPLNWHYSESSNCVRSLPTPTRQLAMGDQKCPHTRTVKHSLQTKKCYDYEIILRISSSFSNKKYFTWFYVTLFATITLKSWKCMYIYGGRNMVSKFKSISTIKLQ